MRARIKRRTSCLNGWFSLAQGELSLQFTEGDHLAIHFIPQPKLNGFQTVEELQLGSLLEKGMGVVAALQVVVRNLRVEVVDVMETNVAREPLKDFGEVVEAASFHGGSGVIPFLAGGPIRIFELMLYVKQPETKARRNGHHR